MDAYGAGGERLLPKGRKTRGLLAVLALNAGRPVLRDELSELLWSRREREQARASLRQAVHELGDLLGGVDSGLFFADRTHLSLGRTQPGRAADELVWVDTQVLSHPGIMRSEVVELFRPGFIEDLVGIDPTFDRWRAMQTERFSGLARSRAEEWLAICQGDEAADGGIEAMVNAAELLIGIDRAHEGAWRALIRAHAARGDRAAAVSAYERCADALAAVAQLAPSEETTALLSTIRNRHVASIGPVAARVGPVARNAKIRDAAAEDSGLVRQRPKRIGVLPLRILNQGQDDELSLGLSEEITYGLSRLNGLSCIAPTSMMALAQQSAGQDHGAGIWQPLDLDLLLEGTVQRGGGQVRVLIRLLDIRAGEEVIWAGRFDRCETDILTLQEEIAAETVAQLDPELLQWEGQNAHENCKDNPNAGDLLLQALPAVHRLEPDGFQKAGELLSAAIDLDPGNGSVHAWYAYWHLLLVGHGWAEDAAAATRRGEGLAERALMLDPTDAWALTIAGHVRACLRRGAPEALALHERALAVDPDLALAWCFAGLSLSYIGRHEEAIEKIAYARKLSPFDPHGFLFETAAAMPYLMMQLYEQASEFGNRAIALNPSFLSTYRGQLAALGHLGHRAEAADLRSRLLALDPGFCVREALAHSPLTRPQDLARYADGLRLAGLKEDGP